MTDFPKKRGRQLSAHEEDLWRAVMHDVIRLREEQSDIHWKAEKPTEPNREKTTGPVSPVSKKKPALAPLVKPASSPSSMGTPLHLGETRGVDKRTSERLDRGRLPIEGRLDLHGMVQSAAHGALVYFIQQSHAAGKRCVLVITGKGGRSRDESPFHREESGVLRRSVPRWLNEAGLRDKILKFTYAQPRDGGEGALYILLRRKR